jgi:hypothetical protein
METGRNALLLLTAIPGIFIRANLFQKHSILRRVFKDGIMYNGRSYRTRTPFINPALSHNLLRLKEKGLLFWNNPLKIMNKLSFAALNKLPDA